MAKARKLKSGSWNVTVFSYTDSNGKRHYESFTADTKAQAELLAAQFKSQKELKAEKKVNKEITIGEAIDTYIETSEFLSPTTLQFYRSVRKNYFQELMSEKVRKCNDDTMQVAINNEARKVSPRKGTQLSPKSVKLAWGVIATSLKAVCKQTYVVKLPKQQPKIKELPPPEAVVEAVRGSDIELPCLLAMWLSFSMSEIRGLMCSSVQDDYITISQVMVDVESVPTIKQNAKTATRLRKHHLHPYLVQLVESQQSYQDYKRTGVDALLIRMNRNQIAHRWQRICKEHNFTMTFHDLRHMNASIMALLNVPEKYAMERGGWSTPHVMKSVYQHTFSRERIAVDQRIDGYFERLMQNENAKQTPKSVEN